MACNILIVEDDAHIAKYIQACLDVGNYKSEICGDGLSALEEIGRGGWDLILLDVMLPGMNGFEVMDRVKGCGIPVIYLTAVCDVAEKVRGLKSGAEDYIVKPFEALELLARIELVLKRCRKSESPYVYGDIVVSRERLLSAVWNYSFEGQTRTVDTHVQQVRKKLQLQGLLVTVPPYGYKLLKKKFWLLPAASAVKFTG